MKPATPRRRSVALVLSSGRVIVLAHQSMTLESSTTFALPAFTLGPGEGADAAVVRMARAMLGGEVSGLRRLPAAPPDAAGTGAPEVELWAARLVGHRPGRWSWRTSHAGPEDCTNDGAGEPVHVLEVAIEVLHELDIEPAGVAAALRAVVDSERPMDMLLGIHAAEVPDLGEDDAGAGLARQRAVKRLETEHFTRS